MGSRCLYGSISSSSVTMNKLPLRCPRSLRRSARSFSTSRRCAADHVRIVEVGPRDGLQNEKSTIPLDTKLELIRRLAQTGVTHMEAGSFVPPKWVPQMASTAEILETILTDPPSAPQGIAYNYLIPNTRGLESLVKIFQAKGAKNPTAYPTPPPSPQPEQSQGQGPITSTANSTEISLFAAATEAFSQKNTNCSIAESLERSKPIMELAKQHNIRVRGYVSVALGCPFEGPDVDPHKVAEITA